MNAQNTVNKCGLNELRIDRNDQLRVALLTKLSIQIKKYYLDYRKDMEFM